MRRNVPYVNSITFPHTILRIYYNFQYFIEVFVYKEENCHQQ